MRLIQLTSAAGPRVGIVEEPSIRLLSRTPSVYALIEACLRERLTPAAAIARELSSEVLAYDPIYLGDSDWRIAVPIHHPADAAHCLVTGTGLTHKASAQNRDAMHAASQTITDSTRMYQLGIEGGRPAAGSIGVSPEWFYKGTGGILRAHNEPLTVPEFSEDGGEEPEVAGVYIIDYAGVPRRIGFTIGNEFSDHVFERQNYLYLAASKLRECSIGPELLIESDFQHVSGEVRIERDGETRWSRAIQSGETVMCHSLANIEHHHFKFAAHRQPGDVHIHYFGADAFSFGEGIQLRDGDVMQVRFEGFGRALRNPLKRLARSSIPVTVQPL